MREENLKDTERVSMWANSQEKQLIDSLAFQNEEIVFGKK